MILHGKSSKRTDGDETAAPLCCRASRYLASFCAVLLLSVAIALPAPAKGYETVAFSAQHLGGMRVSFNIILPQDYAASARRYPVLYLLHGYTDHYPAWVTYTHIAQYARRWEEIVVMPEADNGWYVNNYANPKLAWQDYLLHDLIPYVDSHYRTIASRNGRAVAGNSMGGYGAVTLGLKFPQMFAAVASLSGALASARPSYLTSRDNATLKEVIASDFGPPDNPSRKANDPFELVRKVPAAEMPQLYLAIGSSDFLLQQNRDFVKLLSDLKVTYYYCEVPGKHEWPVWNRQIQKVLALQAPVIGARAATATGHF